MFGFIDKIKTESKRFSAAREETKAAKKTKERKEFFFRVWVRKITSDAVKAKINDRFRKMGKALKAGSSWLIITVDGVTTFTLLLPLITYNTAKALPSFLAGVIGRTYLEALSSKA
jgi:hypothetical protein